MKGKTLITLALALGSQIKDKDIIIEGFEFDSRKVKKGDVFFALKGGRVDGHNFLSEVANKGAIAAIVDRSYQGDHCGLTLFFVEDVLGALQNLAKISLSEKKGVRIAITGSYGKTTTKEFVATLLEERFRVFKTIGSANSQAGLPLALLNCEGEPDVYVIEMAMSAPGHIQKLTQIAPPDIALLTQIGISHAAHFSNGIEGIVQAKGEIFSHPSTQLAIMNHRCTPFSSQMPTTPSKLIYGSGEGDYRIHVISEQIMIEEKGVWSPPLKLPFTATHLLENFCAAVAVARSLSLSWEEIARGAARLQPFKRRFEKIEKRGITYINDTFNACPESMCAALQNLPSPNNGKKRISVLGEMKELGIYSENGHDKVAECALAHIDHLLCLGKGTKKMVQLFTQNGRPAEYFECYELLKTRLRDLEQNGDVVLVKGANSDALWRLVEE